jgi:hypothetical protein
MVIIWLLIFAVVAILEPEIDEVELTYLKPNIEVRQDIITELLKKLK